MNEIYCANAIEAFVLEAFGAKELTELPPGLRTEIHNLLEQHRKDFSDRVMFYARNEIESILTRSFASAGADK